jgi:hypothetical protein
VGAIDRNVLLGEDERVGYAVVREQVFVTGADWRLCHRDELGTLVSWPIGRLLGQLGLRAGLLTSEDASGWSLAMGLRAWAAEVEAFIDVPLDSDVGEFIALEDLRGSLLNREGIEDLLRELPADVRAMVEQWLADGPDAEFVRLTEPDLDRLLRRADLVSRAPALVCQGSAARARACRAGA